jgi:hypothetical protein
MKFATAGSGEHERMRREGLDPLEGKVPLEISPRFENGLSGGKRSGFRLASDFRV